MSLFKPAEMKQSYLKMGIYGNAKSGKTYTSSLIAVGLHKLIKSTKPVAFFDTETGSEYVLPTLYQPANIPLISIKSRSFSDLREALKEAEKISNILIIDSITHVWLEIQNAYKKKNKIDYVEFQDWAPIKAEWAAFTTDYLNSNLHVIVCGRAQDIWEESVDSKGRKEKNVVGTKMATEKGLSYEPSLLVEMEKEFDPKTGFITPRAWVMGDRFTKLDGKCFDKPTFKTFLPHIEMLNLGGQHEGIDETRNSESLFTPGNRDSRVEYAKTRDIFLEEIKAEMDLRFPGMGTNEKNFRNEVLMELFGTYSKTAIDGLKIEQLEEALKKLRTEEKYKHKSEAK